MQNISDIIIDMLSRVAPLLEQPMTVAERAQELRRLEQSLRTDWGGVSHYVPRTGTSYRERAERVLNANQQGRKMVWIAKAEGVTERRVRQIIDASRAQKK